MRARITNIQELHAEIDRLKQEKKIQEEFLVNQFQLAKHKVQAPARIANMVVSQVPGVGMIKDLVSGITKVNKGNSKSDWLTKTIQLGLPLVLNRTLLKRAGWLKKAVVLLASETAAKNVNQASVSSVVSKLASFIRPKKKDKEAKEESDDILEAKPPLHPPMITAEESVQDNIYGIPKDSEAF